MGFSFCFFLSGGGGGGDDPTLGCSSMTGVVGVSSVKGVPPPSSTGKGSSASVRVLFAEGLRGVLELMARG